MSKPRKINLTGLFVGLLVSILVLVYAYIAIPPIQIGGYVLIPLQTGVLLSSFTMIGSTLLSLRYKPVATSRGATQEEGRGEISVEAEVEPLTPRADEIVMPEITKFGKAEFGPSVLMLPNESVLVRGENGSFTPAETIKTQDGSVLIKMEDGSYRPLSEMLEKSKEFDLRDFEELAQEPQEEEAVESLVRKLSPRAREAIAEVLEPEPQKPVVFDPKRLPGPIAELYGALPPDVQLEIQKIYSSAKDSAERKPIKTLSELEAEKFQPRKTVGTRRDFLNRRKRGEEELGEEAETPKAPRIRRKTRDTPRRQRLAKHRKGD